MKRLAVVVFCACRSSSPANVEITAPLASAVIAPVHDEIVIPRGAKRMIVKEDAPWAATFPTSKTFATYDLPAASRILLTWRVGKSHVVKSSLASEDDYPGNHVAPADLVVTAKGDTRIVALGELSGSVEPYALSWCAKDETADRHPRAFAATFAIGTPQGDDELAIVRDGRTLHVLHRETTDGKCDDDAKQGPLDVCEGSEWNRVADLRMASDSELWEIVTSEGKTLSCDPE